jgi:hypothetical protein
VRHGDAVAALLEREPAHQRLVVQFELFGRDQFLERKVR